MTGQVRVACVGAGYFAAFHIDSWQRMPGVDLVGICDLDLARAQAFGAPAFDDLPTLLAQTKPDVLDIILPPVAQAKALHQALEHDLRAMICQKPFGTDLAQAEALTAAAEAVSIPLIIHENFRFQPWYRAIKAALDAGQIGTVQNAIFRLRPGDGQGAEAYLDRQPYFRDMPRFLIRETGVHFVDVFRYLLGNPVSVYADLRRLNPGISGEDAGLVLFDHGGGVRSIFDGNRHLDHAADNPRRTMGEALIEGTRGSLTLTGDGAVHLRPFGSGTATLLSPPNTWEGFGGDCVHALQAHVVAALTQGAPFENRARDYLVVRRIEDAIYRSSETGQRITLD